MRFRIIQRGGRYLVQRRVYFFWWVWDKVDYLGRPFRFNDLEEAEFHIDTEHGMKIIKEFKVGK